MVCLSLTNVIQSRSKQIRAADEYEGLHTDSEIGINLPSVSEDDHGRIILSLSNVRSMARHWEDVVGDTKLMHSHVLALTETQMIHSDSTDNIERGILPYALTQHNHHEDKYQRMACWTSPTVNFQHLSYFSDINGWLFKIQKNKDTYLYCCYTGLNIW